MHNELYYDSSDSEQSSSISSSKPISDKPPQSPEMSILVEEFQFQLMNEYQDFPLIKDKNHNFAPTIDQLQDMIQAIHQKMPDKDTRKVIKLLYKNLVPRNLHRIRRKIPDQHTTNVQEVRETLYQKSPFFKIQSNIRTIDNLRKYASFKKVYLRSSWRPPTFDNPNLQMRYDMKRVAAISLNQRQHSIQDFRQELFMHNIKVKVDGEEYKTITESVVIEAYRFLENFIINQCEIKIHRLARHQIRTICTRLSRCRQTLKKQESEVFLNILRIQYGLCDITLDEYYTIKFYWTTQKGLRLILLRKFNLASGKPCQKQDDDTKSVVYEKVVKSAAGGIKNLWSIKLEREFIQIYKTNQYFLKIKAHFIANYPEHKELFQGHSLKNRLFQILRAAMKKVRQTAARYPQKQPKLVKLDDDKIKFFLKSSRALRARLMLVDIYLDDNRAFTERIEAVILQMNAALEDRDPNRSVCSYSNTTQMSHEEIVIARRERKDKRRLQLQKQRKQKREMAKKAPPVAIVKQQKPLLYSQYNKYFKNQCKRQELYQPDKYHQQIAKKLQSDPEKYQRYMQDQQSSYPSQFYYAKRQ